ncbi:hypothetical protein BpHYR1_012294 [Brachionus plicatilis]|uniref:Uncharacterized protein n=1 Tax=Brachionus plicatilis TaxID=10195 RepID=A0A3M7RR96_BRAPC|nr:hypothetical protein BpHYR1_012294 [Brachionus plicatilis]
MQGVFYAKIFLSKPCSQEFGHVVKLDFFPLRKKVYLAYPESSFSHSCATITVFNVYVSELTYLGLKEIQTHKVLNIAYLFALHSFNIIYQYHVFKKQNENNFTFSYFYIF